MGLPGPILEIITEKFMDRLSSFHDYLSFSEVSKSFRSFAREERQRYQKPWVMLPNKPGEKTRDFYSPLEGKVYKVKLPKVVRRSWCCGSYGGWLIMSHKTRGNFIYNPITRLRLKLPTHHVEHDYRPWKPRTRTHHIKRCPCFITKVVLSNGPTSSGSGSFLAAAITENDMILVTFSSPHMDRDNYKWRQFCPLTLQEQQGLLQPALGLLQPAFVVDCERDDDSSDDADDNDDDDDNDNEVDEIDDDDNNGVDEGNEDNNGVDEGNEENDEDHDIEVKGVQKEKFIDDVIFYKGEFYAINENGKLWAFKVINNQDVSAKKVNMFPLKLKLKEFKLGSSRAYYLVESIYGELLMVIRIMSMDVDWEGPCKVGAWGYKTHKFLVFRFDQSTCDEPFKWVRMESIGDQVLFLGKNCSKSVPSTHIQQLENRIYFTDPVGSQFYEYDLRRPFSYKDNGVYHFSDGHIDRLLPFELDLAHLYSFKCHPVIFTPDPR